MNFTNKYVGTLGFVAILSASITQAMLDPRSLQELEIKRREAAIALKKGGDVTKMKTKEFNEWKGDVNDKITEIARISETAARALRAQRDAEIKKIQDKVIHIMGKDPYDYFDEQNDNITASIQAEYDEKDQDFDAQEDLIIEYKKDVELIKRSGLLDEEQIIKLDKNVKDREVQLINFVLQWGGDVLRNIGNRLEEAKAGINRAIEQADEADKKSYLLYQDNVDEIIALFKNIGSKGPGDNDFGLGSLEKNNNNIIFNDKYYVMQGSNKDIREEFQKRVNAVWDGIGALIHIWGEYIEKVFMDNPKQKQAGNGDDYQAEYNVVSNEKPLNELRVLEGIFLSLFQRDSNAKWMKNKEQTEMDLEEKLEKLLGERYDKQVVLEN